MCKCIRNARSYTEQYCTCMYTVEPLLFRITRVRTHQHIEAPQYMYVYRYTESWMLHVSGNVLD